MGTEVSRGGWIGPPPFAGWAMATMTSVRAACSVVFACASFGTALAVLLSREEPGLAAATNQSRTDHDGDGLSDLQELVIGTLPYRADSDRDGYSDLEEKARDSDPMNYSSVPGDAETGLGMCASQENGYVTALAAVYVKNASLDSVRLQFGVVYQGKALRFMPHDFQYSIGFLLPGRDPNDRLAVVEVGVPQALLGHLRHINLYSILTDTTNVADPIVSTLTLADFSGIAMSVEQRRIGISLSGGAGTGTGVTYRPLAGDDRIPAKWKSGEICFQRTSAVGMKGVSIVQEVDGADCLPMDTYCSPSDCSAGVGTSVELPDPAALVGG
jgi:hypothetical protein